MQFQVVVCCFSSTKVDWDLRKEKESNQKLVIFFLMKSQRAGAIFVNGKAHFAEFYSFSVFMAIIFPYSGLKLENFGCGRKSSCHSIIFDNWNRSLSSYCIGNQMSNSNWRNCIFRWLEVTTEPSESAKQLASSLAQT